MDQMDLGPTAAMQIRSVPERVREFYNDMAHAEGKITLGVLLTRIATGATVVATTLDGQSVSAVQTAVAASRMPSHIDALLKAAQAYELIQRASGQPIPHRTAASLTRAIAAEVRRMRTLPAVPAVPLLEGERG